MKKIHILSKLSDHGYPISSKNYHEAHAEADIAEKKKYPNGYQKLKKMQKHLGKHELMGKNTKKGKIEVEGRFRNYKDEIAYHERVESKTLKRLAKKHHK